MSETTEKWSGAIWNEKLMDLLKALGEIPKIATAYDPWVQVAAKITAMQDQADLMEKEDAQKKEEG